MDERPMQSSAKTIEEHGAEKPDYFYLSRLTAVNRCENAIFKTVNHGITFAPTK
jgi:hypothetical protein